jgi:CubicO group peptidase (beta-lactamase class C family)
VIDPSLASKIVGGVAGAVTDTGVISEVAFGHRMLGEPTPMTTDTVFWIASMTKPLVGTAAMMLVEEGRLGLDEPLEKILPALGEVGVLSGFDAAEQPILRPPSRKITLRHLLTHTAGFCYDTWDPGMVRYLAATGTSRLDVPLSFNPGERWHYGTGIDWVGKVIMAVTGQRLDLYLRDHVLAPLGMHDTGFLLNDPTRARQAGMHRRLPDGSLAKIPFNAPQDAAAFTGGGGLHGTVPDYLRFIRMIIGDGRLDDVQLLQPATVALMAENHIGDLTAGEMSTALPETSNDVAFFPGMPKKWGLTFLINTHDVPGARSAGSLAWGGLFNTYFWIDRQRKVGGVLMSQLLPFADPPTLALFDAFERRVYEGLNLPCCTAT